MADPFMRVDISQASRDFQPVAVDPGLPLLDRSNSNRQTIRKWLGRLVAEPDRMGDRVAFYVFDDESRRIDSAFCIPVSEKDLAGDLLNDFRELQNRFDSVKTQSSNEQLIHRVIGEQLRSIADDNERDRHTCLFKFRDGKNKLRLVWAPGYKRRDKEPAVPHVCTNPVCLNLFLRRGNSIPNCGICHAVQTKSMFERRGRNYLGMFIRFVACACFVAVGVGGAIWWRQREPLNTSNSKRDPVTPVQDGEPKPMALHWSSNQAAFVTIPVGAEFSEWTVEAVSNDGTVKDVSKDVTLVVDYNSAMPILSDQRLRSTVDPKLNDGMNPKMSAAAIRGGRIIGVTAGESTVHAVYGGNSTTTGLTVAVTNNLDVDEIRVDPPNVDLIVGESASLKAIGFKSGKTVGEITNCGELVWKSGDEQRVGSDGPQINAQKSGSTLLTASIGPIKSKPCKVVVHVADENGNAPVAVGRIAIFPSQLRMKTGEIAKLGHEIIVKRKELDVTDSCEVVTSPTRTVVYEDNSRTLMAASPGHSRITFIVGDQSAVLDIDVEPLVAPAANSSIVVEPSFGKLAVGEKLPLRVFVVTPDGTRIPLNAVMSSSASSVATISGMEIQGMSPGEVIVEARAPGIDQVGRAIFMIENVEFNRLTFKPASLGVAIGQRKSFEVFGVSRRGRVRLGDDPNLKLVGVRADEDSGIDLSGSDCYEVVGLGPGTGAIIAMWKGALKQRMPVTIKADRILELEIQPADISVTEGMTVNYQIMARREGRLQPLDVVDGIELAVEVTGIASVHDLQVTAVKSGTTRIVAKYATLEAAAQLTVVPRSQRVASPAVPKKLRFLTDVLQMELGDISSPVHIVRVMSDGSEEDADRLATVTFRDAQNVVEVQPTSAGIVLRTNAIGRTEIEASMGHLRTQRPALVDVIPKVFHQQELRARPESLRMRVGETKKFLRAEILPVLNGAPIPVSFTVASTPNSSIEVRADGTIHGLAVGTAVVTITANDSEGKYAGVENSATVEIVDP